MPKSSSWWQKLLGSPASASQRRERLEPGSADHDHAPLARDDWSNVPEAPESLRDLKWADSPLRAKPRSAPAPSPAPAHIPHAVPTPPELAPPVSGDPSLGLRKRRVHTDQPQSELLSAELEEAPEAVAALVPSGAELALPTDVVSLDSDGPLIDLASYPDDEPAAEPAAETPARDPRLDLALYEAARAGRVEEALALLEQGADPHAGPAESSRDRRHLPLIAAVLPDLRLLRALIARGLSVNETSNGVTPLLAACKDSWHGRPDAVMTLIANGSDVRQTDPDGNTPLHHAARSSDPGVAAMLLDAGASLDALNHAGQSPLGTAMESGNFRLARFLLDKGAGIQLNGGRSPLFDAAAIDDDDIGGVQLLLRHKVKVNVQDAQGRTPLQLAAQHGNADIIGLLLEAGADPLIRDQDGMNAPLHAVAAGRGLAFKRLHEALSGTPAANWSVDGAGNTALHWALNAEGTTADLVGQLLAAGVDAQAVDREGRRPVDLAARNGRWKLLSALDPDYELPSSLRELDGDGSSQDASPIALLREALDQGDPTPRADLVPLLSARDLGLLMHRIDALPTPERIRWLLQQGADPQVPDMRGDVLAFHLMDRMPAAADALQVLLDAGHSPSGHGGFARFLHSVAQSVGKPVWTPEIASRMQTMAIDLLNRGADPFGRDLLGQGALEHAVRLGWVPVVTRLLEIGLDPNRPAARGLSPMYLATEQGSEPMVRALIKAGASPNALAADGQSPLGVALASGDDQLARWLDWRQWNFPRRPLRGSDLPAAAMVGDLEAVRRLLDLGFDVDSQDDRSCTALLRAAGGGHRAVVQLLLSREASPQIAATSGATPLSAAASMRQLDIVDDLIAAGANVNKTLPGELSVLNLSAALGLPDVADRLLKAGADFNVRDARGRTALHCAAMQAFTATDSERVLELFRVLLDNGGRAYINSEAAGATPLLMLLGSVAEPGTQANETVINAALRVLLDAGASLETQDPRGFTPLHLAALHGLPSVVRQLLMAGADPEARDSLNRRAQELALMRGYIDISAELEAH